MCIKDQLLVPTYVFDMIIYVITENVGDEVPMEMRKMKICGKNLNRFETFNYLGSTLSKNGSLEKEIVHSHQCRFNE